MKVDVTGMQGDAATGQLKNLEVASWNAGHMFSSKKEQMSILQVMQDTDKNDKLGSSFPRRKELKKYQEIKILSQPSKEDPKLVSRWFIFC